MLEAQCLVTSWWFLEVTNGTEDWLYNFTTWELPKEETGNRNPQKISFGLLTLPPFSQVVYSKNRLLRAKPSMEQPLSPEVSSAKRTVQVNCLCPKTWDFWAAHLARVSLNSTWVALLPHHRQSLSERQQKMPTVMEHFQTVMGSALPINRCPSFVTN